MVNLRRHENFGESEPNRATNIQCPLIILVPLEDHYLGDSAWKNFVMAHRKELANEKPSSDLVSALSGHEDIATVIHSIVVDPEEWVKRSIPALDGLNAADCVKTPNGVKSLRECLMRFPV